MPNNIVSSLIVKNIHNQLQDYDFVFCRGKNNTDFLVVFSPNKSNKVLTLDKSEGIANYLEIDGYDVGVVRIYEDMVVVFNPNEDFWLQDDVCVLKLNLKDGIYDVRKDEHLRKISEILKDAGFSCRDVRIEYYSGNVMEIHYMHGVSWKTIKLTPADKEVYDYFLSLFNGGRTNLITAKEVLKVAQEFDHIPLKQLADHIANDRIIFEAIRFTINNDNYMIIPSIKNNWYDNDKVMFQGNFCVISSDKRFVVSDNLFHVLRYVNKVMEDFDNTYLYTTNPEFHKVHISELCDKLYTIDKTRMLIVDYTASKFLCVIYGNILSGNCKAIEGRDGVLIVTKNGAYVFNEDGLKKTDLFDSEDYEYL